MREEIMNNTMKALNEREIEALRWIRRHDGISRKALAEAMGLSQASITNMSKELIDRQYVVEGERVGQGMGRKEVMLQINPNKFRYLGIDIGGYLFRIALSDSNLTIIREQVCLIEEFKRDKDPLPAMLEKINRFLEDAGISASEIDAAGIGVSGIVDAARRRIVNVPNIADWQELDIVSVFERHLGCPVFLDESGRAMAVAEKVFGQAKLVNDFIIVHIAYSIVAGITINGQLLRGFNNVGGLLGHITADERAGRCLCGNYGCLENLVTFPMIKSAYQRESGNQDSVLDALKKNDKTAIDVCISAGKAIGIALSNTVNLFNPEVIYISGPVFENLPIVFEETKRTILLRANRYATVNLRLLSSSYGHNQGMMGALALAGTSILA
ncbi:ROK family protein [Paenibacillus sp. GCM10012303]|uniref:ROK family transcriptional regulator n=1 Tax=Paenibacillus sp. GCM10012303 TaxID=3317340 RepID=UPI0036D21884